MQQTSISQQQNKPVSSLQSLASKSGSSLASLAQKSTLSGGKTGFSHLATRTKPSTLKPTMLQKQQPVVSNQQPIEKKESVEAPKRKEEEQQQEEQQQEEKETPSPISYVPVQDPLWAEPSEAAQFLFQPQQPVMNKEAQQLADSFTQSIQSIFYNVMKSSSNQIKAFDFDVPSPDDIVLAAQTNRSGSAAKKT
jgi:hypothetical protein